MIITKELILSLGVIQEVVDWLNTQEGIWGLPRGEFITKIKESNIDPAYSDWFESTQGLFSPYCIKNFSKSVFLNKWQMRAPGRDITIEYDNLDQVWSIIKQAIDSHLQSEESCFQVHAREIITESGGFRTTGVTEQDYVHAFAHYYATFNMYTGCWENFNTFHEAKTRMLEIKEIRRKEVSSCYHIYQYIQEVDNPEENAAGWLLVETGQTID